LKKKIKWKPLLVCVAIPVLAGIVSGFLTRGGMGTFENLYKPPLAPPGWVFPVVWTVLFVLMGVASYLVLTADAPQEQKSKALKVYAAQLVFNFCWSIIFFNMRQYFFAFVWLVILWALILAAAILFARVSKPAAYLMIPYLLWVTFAGYLNFAIYLLN
jgi:tryptophan-rich sensory protein